MRFSSKTLEKLNVKVPRSWSDYTNVLLNEMRVRRVEGVAQFPIQVTTVEDCTVLASHLDFGQMISARYDQIRRDLNSAKLTVDEAKEVFRLLDAIAENLRNEKVLGFKIIHP